MGKVTDLDSVRRPEKPFQIKSPNVPMSAEVSRARAHGYRLRAEELRVISEEVILPETSRTLRGIAEAYEQMARSLEHTHAP
jgi:hypothetical protein